LLKTTMFKLDKLVVDERVYPRKIIDSMHVNDLVRAFQSGTVLPPIIVAKDSNVLIDGRHRMEAAKKLDIESLPAEIRVYQDDATMLEDAIRHNIHGQQLSHFDCAHCVVLAKKAGLSEDRLAIALCTTQDYINELWTKKTAYHNNEPIAIKRSHAHLAQQSLTAKQFASNEKSTGIHALTAANQLLLLIDGDSVNWDNPRLIEKLEQLYLRLRKVFDHVEIATGDVVREETQEVRSDV